MNFRRLIKTVSMSVAATASVGLGALAFAGTAGAVTSYPNAIQPQSPFTPGTPFDSGQQVDVVVPANSILTSGANIYILECAAPNGVLPVSTTQCDGNTGYAGGTISVEANGAVDLQNDTPLGNLYPIFALPDKVSLGENSPAGATCGVGGANECVLYIGQGGGGDTGMAQPHVFSQVFQVKTDATDSGTANPGDGTPELPLALGLPLAAGGIFGGTILFRRRRAAARPAA